MLTGRHHRDSNAHAYSMSSHLCPVNDFRICEDRYGCSSLNDRYDDRYKKQCDPYGCNYNPFRMGATSFYGKGKAVDTSKKFTYACPCDEKATRANIAV